MCYPSVRSSWKRSRDPFRRAGEGRRCSYAVPCPWSRHYCCQLFVFGVRAGCPACHGHPPCQTSSHAARGGPMPALGGEASHPQGDAAAVREWRAAACSSLNAPAGHDTMEGPRTKELHEDPSHGGSPRRGQAAGKSFGNECAHRLGDCELRSRRSAVTLGKGRWLPDPGCCKLLPSLAGLSLLQGTLSGDPSLTSHSHEASVVSLSSSGWDWRGQTKLGRETGLFQCHFPSANPHHDCD